MIDGNYQALKDVDDIIKVTKGDYYTLVDDIFLDDNKDDCLISEDVNSPFLGLFDLVFAEFKSNTNLPNSPEWKDTKWQSQLSKAVEKGYTVIRTPDGSVYKILNEGSVQSITADDIHSPLNGAYKCLKSCIYEGSEFTTGKVYDITKDIITDDNGVARNIDAIKLDNTKFKQLTIFVDIVTIGFTNNLELTEYLKEGYTSLGCSNGFIKLYKRTQINCMCGKGDENVETK